MKRLLFFFLIILILSKVLVITGCANIIPPTGGPRDSVPPVLVKAVPDNYTVHFKTDHIVLTFDEYLDLKNVREDLVVSPFPKSDPTVDFKLKTVTIKLKDSLQPNTTYALNFGKSIRDNNEGNILKNFTYVFSTGPYIDSLQYSGKVILASTGKADSTLIVILHKKMEDDSTVAKKRPRYFAHVDTGGNFIFHYLEPGTYSIFALKDEGGQKKYTSKNQLFAFADSPIVVGENYKPITLYAYADTTGMAKPPKKTSSKTPAKKPEKEKEKRLIVQLNLNNGQLGLLDTFRFQFQVPLKFFDSSQVRFTDEKFNDIKQFHYIQDTNRKKITLMYNWTPDTKYHLIATKEFAEDTAGDRLLKIDTVSFQTKRESDYGSLRLRFANLDLTKNPVLEFIQNDIIKLSYPFGSSHTFYKKIFEPGDYELRILYDDNKNGVWDPGDYYSHRQPEKVFPVRKKLTVKSNWDNEIDITL
jgi:hypothetical protein